METRRWLCLGEKKVLLTNFITRVSFTLRLFSQLERERERESESERERERPSVHFLVVCLFVGDKAKKVKTMFVH